jgi:aspartate 1-decarboxylase
MLRMLKGKIHRATVTEANLDYEGSVAIDRLLMDAAGILPSEAVDIWNVTRGTRLSTYAIAAPKGSGTVAVNGAAAHLNEAGDIVILAAFVFLDREQAARHVPQAVFVDGANRIVEQRPEKFEAA